jgi:hypothetical protein
VCFTRHHKSDFFLVCAQKFLESQKLFVSVFELLSHHLLPPLKLPMQQRGYE